MMSNEKWPRILRPRTMAGRYLVFAGAAVAWFCVVSLSLFPLLYIFQRLGLSKPTFLAPLFWLSLIVLWQAVVPSIKDLKAYREAEEAKDFARREQELLAVEASGDAKASLALGDMHRDTLVGRDAERALRHYDKAAAQGLEAAKRAAANLRAELSQAEADRQREALEAVIPTVLDATCPNCQAPLSMNSYKCHKCGSRFFLTEGDWTPLPKPAG